MNRCGIYSATWFDSPAQFQRLSSGTPGALNCRAARQSRNGLRPSCRRPSQRQLRMQASADWQSAFANALLKPEEAAPLGLRDPYGRPAPKRFAIYRNNVVAGLIEALKASFPVVRRVTGEEFFKAMARVYV